MKIPVIILAAALLFGGCLTMPEEVPEAYLLEKSSEEGKALEKLKTSIIAKNQEVRVLKDRVKDAEMKLKIEKGRTSILKQEKSLLENRQKQYQLENDAAKMNENAKMMVDNDYQIRAADARLEVAKAGRDLVEAQKETGEAELSVLVAELAEGKAKIARTYLVKKQSTSVPDVKKSGPGPESYADKYAKYLEKQRETLAAKKAAQEEAALKFKKAEDNLRNRDTTK